MKREKELTEYYTKRYNIKELFEKILNKETENMWSEFLSKGYAEEKQLMISVFGKRLSGYGIKWK